jgi:hypothetical protein
MLPPNNVALEGLHSFASYIIQEDSGKVKRFLKQRELDLGSNRAIRESPLRVCAFVENKAATRHLV